MHCYGLLGRCESGADAVTLESSNVEVAVRGFVADLSIELIYLNKTDATVEVAYICPVDAKSAVYSFEAKLEGRVIVGHCVEKKKAKEIYDTAVKSGNAAILGQEDELSGDILHLSLGNLPGGETAELKLKMVLELPVKVDGAVTFTLPTVFNPRYCPSDQTPGPVFHPPVLESKVFPSKSLYSLNVKGEVHGCFKIAKITSSSDPINVEISDEETSALITQDGGANLDHDWSFQIYYQTVHQPHCLQMSGDRTNKGLLKDDVLMLNLFPEVPLEGFSPHNEIIFVVDRSGSMQGSKIAKAKTTLLLFLKSLPAGCRFNIISFGSSFSSLFESSSERYTEKSLKKALELQRSMDADMGGTEIFQALKHVYSKDLISGYARQMIVLTDGEVWNLEQIFDLISRHVDETRVFSVGIGDGASTALIQGIAEAGRGRYEMVIHEDQLQTKVMGLVASMLQDHVTDLKIECEVYPPQTPSLVPNISPVVFGGQHLILYARIQPNSQMKSVKVSWKIGNKELKNEIEEKHCKIVHDSNFSFHRLAAKAQLKQWEKNQDENVQDEIIDLSVSSCVVSKLTSFVGVDQDKKSGDKNFYSKSNIFMDVTAYHRTMVAPYPQAMLFSSRSLIGGGPGSAAGYQRLSSAQVVPFSPSFGAAISVPLTVPRTVCPPAPPVLRRPMREEMGFSFDERAKFKLEMYKSPSKCDDEDLMESTVSDSLIDIISSQKFDGSWNFKDCFKLIDVTEDVIKAIQKKISLTDDVLGTVLILVLLEIKFSSREQEWKLVSLKARKFLEAKNVEISEAIEMCSREIKDLL